MKLNAGIITEKLAECKSFYTEVLGFGISFESDFYILLHTPNKESEVSFLLANHPSQQSIFKNSFNGQGVYFTIDVEDVDAVYETIKQKNIPVVFEIRDEPWGDRHFAIQDPNGVAIDVVTYNPQ